MVKTSIELWELFYRYARRTGFKKEDAEDFASYAYSKSLAGRNADNRYLLIDFMRLTFGDTERAGEAGKLKASDRLRGVEFDEKLIKDQKEVEDLTSDIVRMAEKLHGNERIVFLLVNSYELTQREVAFMLGMSDSRVNQINKKVLSDVAEMCSPKKFGKFGMYH